MVARWQAATVCYCTARNSSRKRMKEPRERRVRVVGRERALRTGARGALSNPAQRCWPPNSIPATGETAPGGDFSLSRQRRHETLTLGPICVEGPDHDSAERRGGKKDRTIHDPFRGGPVCELGGWGRCRPTNFSRAGRRRRRGGHGRFTHVFPRRTKHVKPNTPPWR